MKRSRPSVRPNWPAKSKSAGSSRSASSSTSSTASRSTSDAGARDPRRSVVVAYVAPERLTLLPFPQAWMDGSLSVRVVALPRGTPMAPLMTGVPGLADAPSFAEGELQLELRVIPSLDKLPDPADVALPAIDTGAVSPASRLPLFQAVEAQFVIDPAIEAGTKNPRRAGRQIKK